ncbi:hypothetical protein D4764_17G0007170 [Takifugu flavidus]|uniref:Uncharacterized protein n=1 Tax=Takifugu flavidus TaxID=433684 RepID=A0A5C6NUQ3_9TELE|nr:hypothetical protein D4764_17G0007170 [Takifugu flavidus]
MTIDRCRVCITADAAPIRLSISCFILPSHVNKTPRYLGQDLLFDLEKAQPRRRATLTGNKFDLLPAMQTKL